MFFLKIIYNKNKLTLHLNIRISVIDFYMGAVFSQSQNTYKLLELYTMQGIVMCAEQYVFEHEINS